MQDDVLIVRPGGALRGVVEAGRAASPASANIALPGDKSLSHRAALFAALAEGESRVENFLVSGVTRAMLGALTDLGVSWELDGARLRVEGRGLGGSPHQERVTIDCGNSATTMRLLAGALAAWNLDAVLDGSPGLRRRPMRRIVEPLQRMGVDIQSTDGCAPLTLRPTRLPLKALDYTSPVASAQVKSCLLLAGLAADGETVLRDPGPSRDHTERMLRGMGVEVRSERSPATGDEGAAIGDRGAQDELRDAFYVTRLTPPEGGVLAPLDLALPGDISAAAFLIVAALITPGSQVTLSGVGLNPTRTGLLDALTAMGAGLRVTNESKRGDEPVGDLIVSHTPLRGAQVGGDLVVRMIDEFPAFAVAAAYARGTTVVSEATELRHKESDRIHALCGELEALGVRVSERADGFVIEGGSPVRGGTINPHGDHRLAMSLAVAGLAAQEPLHVKGARIIHESFPAFSAVLSHLGARIE